VKRKMKPKVSQSPSLLSSAKMPQMMVGELPGKTMLGQIPGAMLGQIPGTTPISNALTPVVAVKPAKKRRRGK
jgi:hypothetical protein